MLVMLVCSIKTEKGNVVMAFPLSILAESEGFKPPIPIRVYRISSPARSITLPTLQ